MIDIHDLTFHYPHGVPIFEGFSLSIARGETWSIIGPSGCGKTTLLYLLAGLRPITSGKIMIDSAPLTRPRPRTGVILQDYGLLPWATVRQNVELGLKVRNFYGPDGTHAPLSLPPGKDVTYWLERLGIATIADKYPAQISGGQRQRTAIARTFILQPDLLLMDEPFSSLDAAIREDLQRLTLELCAEQNLTMIMITHAIEEAAAMGQKILVLGQPPTQQARVITNPAGGTPLYRQHSAYRILTEQLRREINAHETA